MFAGKTADLRPVFRKNGRAFFKNKERNMWDWWKNLSSGIKNNADSLQAAGALVGGLGSAYSAYKQGKAADKTYKLNLDLLKEEKRRRNQAQQNLEQGWLSAMSKRKDEENAI